MLHAHTTHTTHTTHERGEAIDDPTDDPMENARSRLNTVAVDLLVTVGLIGSIMNRYPEEVQENFADKIEGLVEHLVKEQGEFTEFGEALDEHVED